MSSPEAVVLFGASGFIGRNVADALRGQVGLLVGVNRAGAPVPGCASTVALDGLDAVPPLPQDTVLVNVAAFRYAPATFARDQADIVGTNVAITNAAYRFAQARGITEVRAASSVAVYPASWPVQDDDRSLDLNDAPHAGEAPYAWSKRWGEIAAELWHKRGICTVSFRLSNPYGLHDGLDESQAHVATAFVLRALRHGPDFEVRGDPDAERDFVFAGDAALAFRASLALRGVQDAVNLAAGHTTKVSALAEAAMAAAGTARPLRLSAPPAPGGVKVRFAKAERLRRLLPDLPPFRSLADGMRATVDWYRDAVS